jgi:hypothetical protein
VTIVTNRNKFGCILVEINQNLDNIDERDKACCCERRELGSSIRRKGGQALSDRRMGPQNSQLSTLSIYVPLAKSVSIGLVRASRIRSKQLDVTLLMLLPKSICLSSLVILRSSQRSPNYKVPISLPNNIVVGYSDETL